MPTPLAESQVSLRDAATGLNVTVFSVDPTSYNPFANAQRGSSHQVLDGTQVHQFFGLQQADFVIQFETQITDYVTAQELWTKYLNRGNIWELRDWFPNIFRVVFTPGEQAFHPVPIIGSNSAFIATLHFRVLEVLQWFGGSFS